MPGFLYYHKGAQPTLADTREWGLGYALSTQPECRECQANTPDGGRGYVFADSKRVANVKMDLDNQVWRKMPGKDVWVGYWKDAKPTPADLARKEQLAGFSIKMADGNEWLIPVVRYFDVAEEKPAPALPCIYDIDDAGQLVQGDIPECHRWLWDLTEPFWLAMERGENTSNQDCLDAACKLIGANYVVDLTELAGLLRIFSPQLSPIGVVSLAIDHGTFRDWTAKKNETSQSPTEDTSSTSLGEKAA